MPKSITVEIEPEVLKWLINVNGYKIEDVAKRLRTSKDVVEKWLNRENKPSLKQIKDLSEFFGCSLAVFLLPEPPEELPLPKDRRTIRDSKPLSPKTYKAVRTARWIQYLTESLMRNLNLDTKPKLESFSSTEDPYKKNNADPFIISLSLIKENQQKLLQPRYTIVTEEVSKNNANKPMIPDVCKHYNTKCLNLNEFLKRELEMDIKIKNNR